MSRAALAREASLHERTLKRIEDAEPGYTPTRVTLNKICNGLNRAATSGHRYTIHEIFPELTPSPDSLT